MVSEKARSSRRQEPRVVRAVWVDTVVTGVVAALLSLGAAGFLISGADDDRAQLLDDDAGLIFESIERGLGRIESDLLAFKGLFDASRVVDNDEFNAFASTMGILDRVATVALIRAVAHEDLAAFEQEMSESIPGYQAFSLAGGIRTDPPEVAIHYLVAAMARRDDFPDGLGLDAASVPPTPGAVETALETGVLTTTEPYPFVLTNELGFITVLPLDPVPRELPGVLIAGKHGNELIAEQVPAHLQAGFDVTLATDATEPPTRGLLYRSTVIEFGGRPWTVTAQAQPSMAYTAPPSEAPIFLGVAFLLTLASASIAYNRSRNNLIVADLAAAQAMNREKDDFLSSVSHQLRTPLTSVSGFTKQLLASWDDLSDTDRIEFLRIVDSQADDMGWLVQNLLVASRAKSGLASVKPVTTNLSELATDVIRTLPEPRDRSIHLTPGEAWALADPLRTRQIVRNLLVNAFDHGGLEIEIRCFAAGDEAVVEVRDNGPGVPESVSAVLFDRYTHSGSRSPLVSTGLGLDVSHTLTNLMRGRLSYRRDAETTVFSLHLPAAEKAGTGQTEDSPDLDLRAPETDVVPGSSRQHGTPGL